MELTLESKLIQMRMKAYVQNRSEPSSGILFSGLCNQTKQSHLAVFSIIRNANGCYDFVSIYSGAPPAKQAKTTITRWHTAHSNLQNQGKTAVLPVLPVLSPYGAPIIDLTQYLPLQIFRPAFGHVMQRGATLTRITYGADFDDEHTLTSRIKPTSIVKTGFSSIDEAKWPTVRFVILFDLFVCLLLLVCAVDLHQQ